MARDTLTKTRQALEEEDESSTPPDTKAAAHRAPGIEGPKVEGRGDPFFGHEPEDDLLLGISDEEYEGVLGTVEERILAESGNRAEREAGEETQQETEEVTMNMVLVLPSEFSTPGGQTGGLDDDVAEEKLGQRPKTKEELLAVAFNEVIPRDEPNKYRHLKPLYISAHVEGVPKSKVFVDCGATVNILPYTLMRKLAKTREDLIPSDVFMSSFVGDKSKTIGVLPLKISVADQTRIAAFYVVESSVDYNILLGRDWIHQGGCIPCSLFQRVSLHPTDEKPFETNAVQARIYDDDVGWVVLTGHDASGRPTRTTAQKVLELGVENARQDSAREPNSPINLIEFLHEVGEADTLTIDDLETVPAEMEDDYPEVQDPSLVEQELKIKEGFRPFQQSPRRFSTEVQLKVKEEIERLLEAGFIRTALYVEWLANIVPVLKKTGALRICTDYRNLNLATPKDEYPMPTSDLLEDVHKTAFRCLGAIGTYEWVVMPFGLKNADATYQRAMNLIFHDLIGRTVEVYIDDVVVKSPSRANHPGHLCQAFARMRAHGLRMNPKKCAFGVTTGNFPGFLVHQRGIEVDKNKATAIMAAPPPKTKKELQSFLGKVNFLRRFISNLAGKIRLLTPLLKLKDAEQFVSEAEHQAALDDIK
ncbi:unnamed protein product, partial [Prunus brigantina]